MKLETGELRPSASDLAGYLDCHHLTELEKAAARGQMKRPAFWDPALEALWARGEAHEKDYVQHLANQGQAPTVIPGIDIDDQSVAATNAAMIAGAPIIVQAALRTGQWAGRADVLRRIERPSDLGEWSYVAIDAKLARETKGSTILQLSLYSDLLGNAQGLMPEHMYVVRPWTDFAPEEYRVDDFAAFYRKVKASFEAVLHIDGATYPEPVEHCDICTWKPVCNKQRRDDDHLSLVAGLTKLQGAELESRGVHTLAALAALPLPIDWKPERGTTASYERLCAQARLQLAARQTGVIPYELLAAEAGVGLSLLPEPDDGDIFLDFEGDPFVGEGGLEYLLGYQYRNGGGWRYVALWALDRAQEKAAFEQFIDFVIARLGEHPGLHIYHYGAYERSALTRLMGRYATREEDLDQILRSRRLIDLLTVVRQGVRIGVESYSIKKLEPVYGFEREAALPDANIALTKLQTGLELRDVEAISAADQSVVQRYNQDDCASTLSLRDWLEQRRSEAIDAGATIDRPQPGDAEAPEGVAAWIELITPLIEQLTADVPLDAGGRSPEQHGRWLLASLLDFHRREDKAFWWDYFRLEALPPEDLRDEKSALADLEFVERVGGTDKCPIHRYRFAAQDSDVRKGKGLQKASGDEKRRPYGSIEEISFEDRTIDIKKTQATAEIHAPAVYVFDYVGKEPLKQSLLRLAQFVVANGIDGDGDYVAARDLLLRSPPRLPAPLRHEGESVLEAGKRLGPQLEAGVLPIQGPPGTGKTFTGAHMICDLVDAGKKVGIVANGHKVIRNLINTVIKEAEKTGADVRCVQRIPSDAKEPDQPKLTFAYKNQTLFAALEGGANVAGGTAWLWASEEAFQKVDVLFVDEAAQVSLATVLAASQAAPAMVLLGDPQQLDQPMQGSHPDGTACSALHHVLNGEKTIGPAQGLFLETTWRLHPDICNFTSELFYESKLEPLPGLETQTLGTQGPIGGAGLRFVPVEHRGNSNCSPEEAVTVAQLVNELLTSGATWTDRHGVVRELSLEDVLIIAPYNAQVIEIQKHLAGAEVGTVDKFQGQENPVAIYSLATSSHADAPRGMEFLFSSNRLNVATSRGRCVSIVVASPDLFAADAKAPRQMKLANAFCRFSELATS
jgi:uncharacterized protein